MLKFVRRYTLLIFIVLCSISGNGHPLISSNYHDEITSIQPKKTNQPQKNTHIIKEFKVPGDTSFFVILFSGNGGWLTLASTVTKYFNQHKVSVVGINSHEYFTKKRTPDEIAAFISGLISDYSKKWQKQDVVLLGYSMGAEILPFAVNRLPDTSLRLVKDLILLAPSRKCTFHDQTLDHIYDRRRGPFIIPEINNLKLKKLFIICDDGSFALCKEPLPSFIEQDMMKGGHHFGKKYDLLNRKIGRRLKLEGGRSE